MAAGAVAVDIAHIGLLYLVIIQTRVRQGGTGGRGGHHIIAFGFAGFLERDHPDAADIGFVGHLCLLYWNRP